MRCWKIASRAFYCLKGYREIINGQSFPRHRPAQLRSSSKKERSSDPRYVDGQRLLVEAMRYLAQSDPITNRSAIELISEHVRTRFRMSDSPLA